MDESVVGAALLERGITFHAGMSIVGIVRPTVGAYKYGLGGVMRINKEHVLNFNGHGISVMPLSDLNGRPSAEDAVLIPTDQIVETRISMKWLGFNLVIETQKGPVEYKVRHYAIGMPWHRENLAALLLAARGK